MPCALIKAHAIAPSKIASPPSCLPLAAWLHVNLGTDVLPLGDKRVRVSRRRIVREVRSPASRDGVTAVYLLRSAQYQFCNCGVLCIYACRGSTCIESISGLWRATWLRKRRRRRRQRRRPARRKRSSRRRHALPSETHQGACTAFPSASRCCRGLMWFSDAKSKPDHDAHVC
jgi:hypothetical protein